MAVKTGRVASAGICTVIACYFFWKCRNTNGYIFSTSSQAQSYTVLFRGSINNYYRIFYTCLSILYINSKNKRAIVLIQKIKRVVHIAFPYLVFRKHVRHKELNKTLHLGDTKQSGGFLQVESFCLQYPH